MVETLRVLAKPGVLVTDHRNLAARRFIGRGYKPPPFDGASFGALDAAGKLYDPSVLHRGDPNDVDELYPISAEPQELAFDVDHKQDGHKNAELARYYRARVAAGELLAADQDTAKKCGVKNVAQTADAPAHTIIEE